MKANGPSMLDSRERNGRKLQGLKGEVRLPALGIVEQEGMVGIIGTAERT